MTYNRINHALAVGEIYFTLQPTKWMYEPKESFEYGGQNYVLAPDFIMGFNGKLYAGELQLEPLSAKRWAKKWEPWNLFFSTKPLFSKAQYQSLVKKPPSLPRFIAITKQSKASEGFNIPQRELITASTPVELLEVLNKSS